MSPVLDNVLVAAALLGSAVYALVALGPRTLRRRALLLAASWVGRAPAWVQLHRVAARLGAAAVKSSGSCGGCDNCGSESGAEPGADAGADAGAGATAGRSSGTEINIPVGSIGRRR